MDDMDGIDDMDKYLMDRMTSLKAAIEKADADYWFSGFSGYSDVDYDAMKRELQEFGLEVPEVIHSPAVLSTRRVVHSRPMLSMRKTYDVEDVLDWIRSVDSPVIEVAPKFDGIALVKYPGGIIATRGDGFTGCDVTERATFCRYVPDGYGEAVISRRNFGGRPFKQFYSQRTAISAILNSEKHADLAAFAEMVDYHSHSHLIDRFSDDSIQEAIDKAISDGFDYPLDGVVFRVADPAAFEALGRTKTFWHGQIAYKF